MTNTTARRRLTGLSPTSSPRTARGRKQPRVGFDVLECRQMLAGSGLVAAYNFDAGNGSVLADVSGNGNNGTITDAAWSTAGKHGGALSFNGSTDSFVTIAEAASLDL